MRNRAKCKKCESIIESKHDQDTCECACGEISVSGGDKLGCSALNWANFLRVDDVGNVIIPTIRDAPKITRGDLLGALDTMIEKIEDMPANAMIVAINHYDFVSLLMLLSSIFRFEEREES